MGSPPSGLHPIDATVLSRLAEGHGRPIIMQGEQNVKRPSFLAAIAAALFCVTLGLAAAQAQQAQPRPQQGLQPGPANIAFIDVNKIFKSHQRFQMMVNEMKADLDKAEAELRKERDSLKALNEQISELRAGTPEYKQREEEIARRQSDLAVRLQLQKKEFMQREARNYYTVYQEMMQEVEYFASNSGVSMVMRFNGDQVDVQNPEHVLRDINKPVLWFPAGCDITGYIIERLNRAGINTAAQPGRPTVPMGPPAVNR